MDINNLKIGDYIDCHTDEIELKHAKIVNLTPTIIDHDKRFIIVVSDINTCHVINVTDITKIYINDS